MQKIRNFLLKIMTSVGMGSSSTFFGIAWRLAVLSLPWQTRWYRETALAGWPWEQGSWAIYVSWIFLAATVVFGLRSSDFRLPTFTALHKTDRILVGFGCIVLVFSCLTSDSYVASVQWLIQVGLLGAFVFTLYQKRVPARSLAAWFAVSLVPHACLAYWQYAIQRVDAVKWLGIAFQSPKQLGVSVVEFADLRYLRSYGGMPHPNILGGWLAVGIVVAWQAAWRAVKKSEALIWMAAGATMAGALVLTFSRSAFLAVGCGLAALAVVFFRKRQDERFDLQFGLLAMVVTLAFAGILAYAQREVLLARTDQGNRLVVQSNDARLQSYAMGWRVLKTKPLFGSGPNAELASLWNVVSKDNPKKPRQPLESPHDVFFLLAVNFGILGAIVFLWVIWRFRKQLLRRWWLLLPFVALGSLDHYLWSYWSGLGLTAMVLSLGCLRGQD